MIYLDYAATTKMSEEALSIYTQVAKDIYGNSQSLHNIGTKAEDLFQICREQLAKTINGKKEGIFFTSGGSESNILALSTLITSRKAKGTHILTTPCEHSSVQNYFKSLTQLGFEITFLKVNQDGILCMDDLKNQIRSTTILASIQFGNSEFGSLQPIQEIGSLLKERDVLFHCDAVQAFGKVPIDVHTLHIDALTFSSHKIYGPKGTGACYLSPNTPWQPFFPGTTHQQGFRPGTLDLPSIAAFTTAALSMIHEMSNETKRLYELKHHVLQQLQKAKLPIQMIGNKNQSLPHIIGLTVAGVEGQHLLLEANRQGYAISTGSACRIGLQQPSQALLALGLSSSEAKSFIRISIGKDTTLAQLDDFCHHFARWIHDLKGVCTT